jgi:hypothetical protein
MKPGSLNDVRLEEEQRDRIKRCLRTAALTQSRTTFKNLIRSVEQAINLFVVDTSNYAMSDRQVHDYLRGLWHLANESDPATGQIRVRIKSAPEQIIRILDYRARPEVPKLYEPTGMPGNEKAALCTGGIRAWAAIASDEALIRTIQTLPPMTGVVEVQGRSRGEGKRSRSRIEPYLYRVARGADNRIAGGGRRSDLDFKFLLISRLATAWGRATGDFPAVGRSDETGFGDLVHSVFQWLGMDGQAEYALRRYWKEFSRS